ncbi:hypothetical protein Pmar_PMAR013741, partial [Perkinsus marinus ATCC 50983]
MELEGFRKSEKYFSKEFET